ncbi:MAG: histidine phosphatase family protein [Candidatus Paceibacteria bacterium]
MNHNNTFYFLRHGETIKDPNKLTVDWSLTPETSEILDTLADNKNFSEITTIYTSHEDKAIKSASPFVSKLNIPLVKMEGLEEVHRGDKYLTDEEFKRQKREKLEDRDSNPDGGESSNEALRRFMTVIEEINNNHNNENILISSHGTILALYFCYIKNDFSNIYDYWESIPFCGVGIIKNQKVIKDFTENN